MAKKKAETPVEETKTYTSTTLTLTVDDGEVAIGLAESDVKNILTALDLASEIDIPDKKTTCGMVAANLREFHNQIHKEMPEEYKTFCELYDPKEKFTRLSDEQQEEQQDGSA